MSRRAGESATARRTRARALAQRLREAYPDSGCALRHASALELLVSTILSAQCTDARVNQVTPGLFGRWPDAAALAGAGLEELAGAVHSCGYHNQKARAIQGCCRLIVEEHAGRVPDRLEELVRLPGVGRKTANCVLGTWYGQPAVVVDTHMIRILGLLDLTESRDPVQIEREVMDLLPPEEWVAFTHRIIDHGRAVCVARRPRCADCGLADLCPAAST
ncbi:MAG: endonuclease III [Candidatus Delongbacteria bacterium]